jgi:hypothetical protein
MTNKYIIRFKGYKTVYASSFDEAKKSVEKELDFIHPNFNIKFDSMEKVEE